MKLGEIWKRKDSDVYAVIDCFVNEIAQPYSTLKIVIREMGTMMGIYGYCTMGGSYVGTQEEIENVYELFLEADRDKIEEWYNNMDKEDAE